MMEEIKECKKKCEKIDQVLSEAMQTDGWYGNISKHIERALYTAEQLTLDIRKMYQMDYTPNVDESQEKLQAITRETMNMDLIIKSKEEIIIRLPMICTKKKYNDKYIRESVGELLATKISTPLMLKNRVVVIIYTYENLEENRFGGESDYDNIETRSIINALTKYILFDDSPQYYQLFQCASRGHPGTEIRVLSRDRFKDWLLTERCV